jgi:sugar/nucleoside kinase (ribokinase family)
MLVSDALSPERSPSGRRRGRQEGRPTLVIGELNVDLIAAGLPGPPRMGREVEAKSFEMVLGSASAIFASGLRRLGHPVGFVGKVGDDFFGQFCRGQLAALGIDTSWVRTTPGATTGVTLCLSSKRDRAQVTFPGAIAELGLSDIPFDAFDGFGHLHLSCFALQKRLRPAFSRLLATAKRQGLSTSFDPNSSLLGQTRKQALRLLPYVDVLFVNEREAAELSGKSSPAAAARVLSKRSACAVVKLGSKGAVLCRGGDIVVVPGRRVRAVDTTGAGDSFAAGFVSAFLAGETDQACLKKGNACGALSTRRVGGTAAQPDQKELTEFLKAVAQRASARETAR